MERRGGRSLGQVSQRARSKGFPISVSALFRYESQGRVPKVDALAAIAAGYGLDFANLCGRVAAELTGQPAPMDQPLSEGARALAEAFETWDPARQAAFLQIAGLPAAREGLPPRAEAPPGRRAAGRGNRP